MNTTSNENRIRHPYLGHRIYPACPRGSRSGRPPRTAFIACTIAALVGSAKDPTYRYFDVKVSGADAKKLVERYIGVDDPKQRPLVRFRLGDLWGDAYIRDKGQHAGKPGASLKARLLKAEPLDRAELASIRQHELITRGIGYLSRPKTSPPRMAIRSCRAASRHWPGLSVNRNIGTSTPSSPPPRPSTWYAGACRPSKGIARC